MSNQHISILLEGISFILVTLDLIGQKRLEKWHEWSTHKLEGTQKFNLMEMYRGLIQKNWLFKLFWYIVGFALFVFFAWVFGHMFIWSIKLEYTLLYLTLTLALGTMASFLFLGFGPLWIEFFLRFLVKLFNKYKLSGLMIIVGSILFFISKYKQW